MGQKKNPGPQENFLVASDPVLNCYLEAQKFAVFVNDRIAETHRDRHPYPFAGGALLSISADALALHRSVYGLCHSGFALAAPILLRTVFELLISAVVIANAGNEAEFIGFRYSYLFLKDVADDPENDAGQRKAAREQLKAAIGQLEPRLREKAREYVFKGKIRTFWYSPEFSGPTDVLQQYSTDEMQWTYRRLSSAAHGGLLGLRLFKDQPDLIHPDPRADKRAQNMALGFSARFLLELSHGRGLFEEVATAVIFRKLLADFVKIRPLISLE